MTTTILRALATAAALLALAAPAALAGQHTRWKQLPTRHASGQVTIAQAERTVQLRRGQDKILRCPGATGPEILAVSRKGGAALTPTVVSGRYQWNAETNTYVAIPGAVGQIVWALSPGDVFYNPSYTSPVGELLNFTQRTVVVSWRCS